MMEDGIGISSMVNTSPFGIDSNGYVSKYYTFDEMTYTDHEHLLDLNRDMAHGNILVNIGYVASLLDYLVDEYNVDPRVTSGYRCPLLNKTVKGSPLSWHKRMDTRNVRGAVDFYVQTWGYNSTPTTIAMETKKLFDLLQDDREFLNTIHKLIYYPSRNFIHVSLATGWRDGRVLIRDKDRMIDVL